jgi:hypothetical protein
MNRGQFGQRGREHPNQIQCPNEWEAMEYLCRVLPLPSSSLPKEISQPTPASTQTPPLRHPNNTALVASGPQVRQAAIPLKATTNPNNAPSGSPLRRVLVLMLMSKPFFGAGTPTKDYPSWS